MSLVNQSIIKHKMGLLNLAKAERLAAGQVRVCNELRKRNIVVSDNTTPTRGGRSS